MLILAGEEKKKKAKPKKKEEGIKVEPSSMFQRQRVDVLLDLITRRFPPKITAAAAPAAAVSATTNGSQGGSHPSLSTTLFPGNKFPDFYHGLWVQQAQSRDNVNHETGIVRKGPSCHFSMRLLEM